MKQKKVLLAMSGGVDSSVAALLLKQQGYKVLGVFMKNWSDTKNDLGECMWRGERRMAQKVAAQLDIPLITVDYEKQYRKLVIDEMFALYKKGITPNPDIDCNEKIKIPLLLKEAQKQKCDFLATGHYVQIKNNKLYRAKDESKDQSYFLYRLKKNQLKKIVFPIGTLTKKEVREIARKHHFPNAEKKGTVGICFVGKVNLKTFLQKKIKAKKGKIFDPEGNLIGHHDGIYYYTIGQRIGPRYGIEIEKNEKRQKKWYVARKSVKKNEIIAAPEGHPLNFRKVMKLKHLHTIDIPIKGNIYARIRHVGELLPATFNTSKKELRLKKEITGVSEGQAAVIYKGKEVLGGGVISFG